MLKRNITDSLLHELRCFPVVFLNGARQTGKSTLVQWLAQKDYPARYVTLDDITMLAAARQDPAGFIAGLESPVIIDEIQRAPELFIVIKAAVDRDPSPGRFLLTGSADVLLLPHLSESLTGRMSICTLWPFSQGEILSLKESFVDMVFAEGLPSRAIDWLSREAVVKQALTGGYPPIYSRSGIRQINSWFSAYVSTLLQRDVRDIANLEHLTMLPRLLTLLAARSMALVNYSELSRSMAMPQSTLKRYMALLETTFLVHLLLPWSANLGKRLVKAPKLVINDTGLMAHLLGLTEEMAMEHSTLLGPLMENFVVLELRKQISWSKTMCRLYHFRAQTGQEVDILLEDQRGNVVGIEVKSAATLRSEDFNGLRFLASALQKRFRRGLVLYGGRDRVPFGENLTALPISALWRMASASRKCNSGRLE